MQIVGTSQNRFHDDPRVNTAIERYRGKDSIEPSDEEIAALKRLASDTEDPNSHKLVEAISAISQIGESRSNFGLMTLVCILHYSFHSSGRDYVSSGGGRGKVKLSNFLKYWEKMGRGPSAGELDILHDHPTIGGLPFPERFQDLQKLIGKDIPPCTESEGKLFDHALKSGFRDATAQLGEFRKAQKAPFTKDEIALFRGVFDSISRRAALLREGENDLDTLDKALKNRPRINKLAKERLAELRVFTEREEGELTAKEMELLAYIIHEDAPHAAEILKALNELREVEGERFSDEKLASLKEIVEYTRAPQDFSISSYMDVGSSYTVSALNEIREACAKDEGKLGPIDYNYYKNLANTLGRLFNYSSDDFLSPKFQIDGALAPQAMQFFSRIARGNENTYSMSAADLSEGLSSLLRKSYSITGDISDVSSSFSDLLDFLEGIYLSPDRNIPINKAFKIGEDFVDFYFTKKPGEREVPVEVLASLLSRFPFLEPSETMKLIDSDESISQLASSLKGSRYPQRLETNPITSESLRDNTGTTMGFGFVTDEELRRTFLWLVENGKPLDSIVTVRFSV